MPRLRKVETEEHDYFTLPGIDWYREATNQAGIAKGGVYLLSGPPGCGKTTLALQLAVDLAASGNKIVYIALEQAPGWLKSTIEKRIFRFKREQLAELIPTNTRHDEPWKLALDTLSSHMKCEDISNQIEEVVNDNLFLDSSVPNMDSLPDFFVRQVLRSSSEYHGAKVLIVDSIQGSGAPSSSTRLFQKLFEFCRHAKDHGVACILIGHVTKAGSIAGPKTLEHNVDAIWYVRKAMKLRPFFVPKNRFGPERYEPFTLIMNHWGCLEKSKHMAAKACLSFGFIPVMGCPVEVQALVKLPKFGTKPGIHAPYLPKQKLQQIIGVVSSIRDIDISDLTFEINCYIPTGSPYSHNLDFALAASMLSSYFQRPLPSCSLFIGELDLTQQIRPLADDGHIRRLVNYLIERNDKGIKRVYVADENAVRLHQLLGPQKTEISIHAVNNLEQFISSLWPDVMEVH